MVGVICWWVLVQPTGYFALSLSLPFAKDDRFTGVHSLHCCIFFVKFALPATAMHCIVLAFAQPNVLFGFTSGSCLSRSQNMLLSC